MNASQHFSLDKKERDVIVKHMWPLTLSPPKYAESYIVVLVDKFFCISEAFSRNRNALVRHLHDEVSDKTPKI